MKRQSEVEERSRENGGKEGTLFDVTLKEEENSCSRKRKKTLLLPPTILQVTKENENHPTERNTEPERKRTAKYPLKRLGELESEVITHYHKYWVLLKHT